LLSTIERAPGDRIVSKTLNDHWVWANLIAPHPVTIVPEADVYARSPQGA
jgi:hypothetical protein